MKIEVNNSPALHEGSQGILAKMKALEAKNRDGMITMRLNAQTIVSCKDKRRIEEYKKSLNIK